MKTEPTYTGPTKYPKHYAKVVRVIMGERHGEIVVAPGRHGRTETLKLGWRTGWGHCGCRGFDFGVGTVVKIYQRPQDNHPKFRRIGS